MATFNLDPTGQSPANYVMAESLTAGTPAQGYSFSWAVLPSGPMIGSVKLRVASLANAANFRNMIEGIDYEHCFPYLAAMGQTNLPVYGGVRFINTNLAAVVGASGAPLGAYAIYASYQAFGTSQSASSGQIATMMQQHKTHDPTLYSWEQLCASVSLNLPALPAFTPAWMSANIDHVKKAIQELERIGLTVHMRPRFLSTPGQTVFIPTAAEVGLGQVPNFPMADSATALAGVDGDKFMSPKLVKDAMTANLTQMLASLGYNVPINYAPGLQIANPSASYLYLSDVYVMRKGQAPFITSGTFEYSKFVKITSLIKDSWRAVAYTVTGNEARGAGGEVLIPTSQAISTRCRCKAIINEAIELVDGEEVHLDGNTFKITYPLRAGDQLKLCYKELKSKQSDDANVYKTYAVTAIGQNTFSIGMLQFESVHDYRVTVNDFVILDAARGDFTITDIGNGQGYVLTITHPLRVGDVVEFENEDAIGSLGKQALRAALQARTL